MTIMTPLPQSWQSRAPLRVAVIEDDAIMLRYLGKLISKNAGLALCGAWESGEAALAEIHALRPDVVLVDLELPGISGEDCIRTLSGLLLKTAFVVLTVHENTERVFGALKAGANGYLLKGSTGATIIDGIQAAHQGGAPLSPEIASLVIRAFQHQAPKKKSIALPSLTPREQQILKLLSTGIVPKEAAAELNISYETVRDYLKQIYQKLHVRSRTEAVLCYLRAGDDST
jgi:DNA-binding NarL/FixJ family response regulator